jgi:hypothetical protein
MDSLISRVVGVAAGPFAPGHIGELTRIVPFEMVDAVLAETRARQRRVRDLPSRVVVYLLLAAGLFADLGYGQVWTRMIAGLGGSGGLSVAVPTAGALAQARRRIGVAPLRALFDLLRGPAAGVSVRGVRWRGLLVTAIDGTILGCPDTPANLAVYHRGGGYQGGTGYPLVRVLALVACGTRTIIDAVFGTDRIGETTYAHDLLPALRRGMIVLADRNFAARDLLAAIADTGADLLVRVKIGRNLPACRQLGDHSYISRIGKLEVRVVTARITVVTDTGHREQVYRLITSVLDPACPPEQIVALYHQRWEIEPPTSSSSPPSWADACCAPVPRPEWNRRSTPCSSPTRRCGSRSATPCSPGPMSIPTEAASVSRCMLPAINSSPPWACSPTPPGTP